MSVVRRLMAAGFAVSVTLVPLSTAAVQASAAPVPVRVVQVANASQSAAAADFIASAWQAKPSSFDAGGLSDAILALASSETHQVEAQQMLAQLEKSAPAYATSAGKAGKVALAVAAMRGDITNFGGLDLASVITTQLDKDPTGGGTFTLSLAILGLQRGGEPVPNSAVLALQKMQDASGAFGYDFGGFTADPDTTAMAIMALIGLKDADSQAALKRAVAWATSQQKAVGYWDNYSPVNTTGLLGAALIDAGVPQPKATAWMINQQKVAGGKGLPNVIDGTEPNLMATVQGILLLSGISYASVTVVPADDATATPTVTTSPSVTPSATTQPSATSEPTATDVVTDSIAPTSAAPTTKPTTPTNALPRTGDQDGLLPLVLVASVGAAGAVALRRVR